MSTSPPFKPTRSNPPLSRRTLIGGAASTLSVAAIPAVLSTVARDAAADEPANEKIKPLSKAQKKWLADIPPDPAPDRLIGDQHFYVSDERQPEKFRHQLKRQGGVYIGVGPEQNYLYVGWTRPEVIILLDFDQMVVDIHDLYCVFFSTAPTPAAMLKLWSKGQRKQGIAAIRAMVSDKKRRTQLERVYVGAKEPIHARLKLMLVRYKAQKVQTFLTDLGHYQYIRGMFLAGRVRAVRGDFTKDKTMNGVAKFAKKMGLPVSYLYLSNVEMYFAYKGGLRHNVEVQPTTATSTILRTIYNDGKKANNYHYVVQSYSDFRAWLKTGVKNVQTMLQKAHPRIKKTKNVWLLPGPQ